MVHRISQSDLARRLGIKPQNVSKYLTGDNFPSIDILRKISDVLNITIDDLIKKDLSDPSFQVKPAAEYEKVENVAKLIEAFENFTNELKEITKPPQP